MNVREVIWDEWNEEHIAGHNIQPDEVEDVCLSPGSLGVRIRRGRYRMIGQTATGRYLMVILDYERAGAFYVVTARDATDSERRRLHKWRNR